MLRAVGAGTWRKGLPSTETREELNGLRGRTSEGDIGWVVSEGIDEQPVPMCDGDTRGYEFLPRLAQAGALTANQKAARDRPP